METTKDEDDALESCVADDDDSDHDGLANEDENDFGTSVHDADSDDDGGILDGDEDNDSDGIVNADEDAQGEDVCEDARLPSWTTRTGRAPSRVLPYLGALLRSVLARLLRRGHRA